MSQPKIAKKLLKPPSKSSMLVPLKSSSAVLMVNTKFVSNCNRSHAKRANRRKIPISYGVPFLMSLFYGNLFTQRQEICSQETRDSTLSYSDNRESISPGLGLVPGCDRQTDRRTEGQNHDS